MNIGCFALSTPWLWINSAIIRNDCILSVFHENTSLRCGLSSSFNSWVDPCIHNCVKDHRVREHLMSPFYAEDESLFLNSPEPRQRFCYCKRVCSHFFYFYRTNCESRADGTGAPYCIVLSRKPAFNPICFFQILTTYCG